MSGLMLPELRESVCKANWDLLKQRLVVGTSGNVSGRDTATGLFVIKPSGVAFDELTPELMVVCDERGNVVEGTLRPSVDAPSHAYVYRHREDVHGVVHTHSVFATVFAVRGEPIPVLTTTHASLFGAPIPVSDYAVIGEEEIGREIVRCLADGGTSVLMRSHGVFTIGKDADRALRAAGYTEESAEVAYYALNRGSVAPMSPEVVEASRRWYLRDYGQASVGQGS